MCAEGKDDLLIGRLLAGRYRLESLLGTGGMGQVYLADDTVGDRGRVAVKILKDRETVEWFKREFETLSLMVHPHIAQVHDFDVEREGNLCFYTCEFVAGRPAHEVLARGGFSEKLNCFVQV